MKVIRPTAITDALLVSSTVAEPSGSDPAVWAGGTTYALDAYAYRAETHRVYKSLNSGNTGNTPESSPTWWSDYGPTNRWAVFDQSVSTRSTASGSASWTIAPGIINSLALIDVVGTTAHIVTTDGATTVYDRTITLSTTNITNWFAYFFEPFSQKGTLVLLDLPPFLYGETEITITGPGTVECGAIIVGVTATLGGTQYGVSAGIRDYSKKVTDAETGVVTLEQGKFAKIMRARIELGADAVNAVHNTLTLLRATPSVWIGDNDGTYEALVVFGFYKDFSLEVAYKTKSFYTLEIEGMT